MQGPDQSISQVPKMSTEDHNEEQEQPDVVAESSPDYQAGQRSITNRGGKTRRQMVSDKSKRQI